MSWSLRIVSIESGRGRKINEIATTFSIRINCTRKIERFQAPKATTTTTHGVLIASTNPPIWMVYMTMDRSYMCIFNLCVLVSFPSSQHYSMVLNGVCISHFFLQSFFVASFTIDLLWLTHTQAATSNSFYFFRRKGRE